MDGLVGLEKRGDNVDDLTELERKCLLAFCAASEYVRTAILALPDVHAETEAGYSRDHLTSATATLIDIASRPH